MEEHVKKSLEEWKEEISDLLVEIDNEYDEVKRELQSYSYKFSIARQVIQSTVNEDLIRDIREIYHTPFEQKFQQLKEEIQDLDEKKKVFQMFIDKIDSVKGRNERQEMLVE